MGKHYYESMAHLVVAADGIAHSESLKTALKSAGCDDNFTAQAGELAHHAEALISEKLDVCGEDRIQEHATHAAATEVEMWHQAVVRRAKKAGLDQKFVNLLAAKALHADEHTATIAARGERALAIIATHEELSEGLGDKRAVRDILNKGQALLKRLYAATVIRLAPSKGEEDLDIFNTMGTHHAEMNEWLAEAMTYAENIAEKDQTTLGWFGLIPEGVGLPIGGTAYSVVLHERGQTEAPDPSRAKECSGWSIGRQGNRENLGAGFLDT